MSTEQPGNSSSYLWYLAGGLGLYCIVLTAMTGDIGFDADDWWILSLPYWNNFSDSLILYARKFLRPIEGVYWISLFQLFGFNRVAFHLCSLLLLAGSAVLMGVSLDRAFPGRQVFVSIAVLLTFFLPPVSCLTYVLFTDNSRLSMLLYWVTVVAFQHWARRSSSWRGLTLPVALYLVSFLTYEASSFLIFLMPVLVWPVHQRCSNQAFDPVFLIKLSGGVVVAFAAAVTVRFVFLNGGAVYHSSLLPPFELLWSYLALLPFYLVAPFMSVSDNRWALLAGFLVALATAGLFFLRNHDRPLDKMGPQGWFQTESGWYLVALGCGILFLGMLPYQLAGYGLCRPPLVETLILKTGPGPGVDLPWFNFTWASRIYSSASFGMAILLACGLTGWRRPSVKLIGRTGALVLIGFMAVFHAGLSQDWREAAEIRNHLVRSLVNQVPAVKSKTNFVFLDIVCSHKRAEVIRRENGLGELIKMLYGDQTLGAWRLYPDEYDRCTHLHQQSVAMPSGFLCGDSQRQREPSPQESLLLLKRSGRELILLDKITARDTSVPTGIEWRGIEHLASNFKRIKACRTMTSPEARLARNAWTSGLISMLRLTRLRSTLASLRGSRYGTVYGARPYPVFKLRLSRIKARL
ncbi:MAG: hypothetical protein ACLQPD_02650 [Desulfomonilaceae bacterium]